MKFKPPDLPANPTPEQWKWWKQCFTDGLVINEITLDAHKLTFLRSMAGSELFALLDNCGTYAEAISVLDGQFERPTRVLSQEYRPILSEHAFWSWITAKPILMIAYPSPTR